MHWLDRYATDYHDWRQTDVEGQMFYSRPLGVVEGSFDSDGVYFEGRADITMELQYNVRTTETEGQIRERILLAYTNLRLNHTMLLATATSEEPRASEGQPRRSDRFFVVRKPNSTSEAIESSRGVTTYLEGEYTGQQLEDFYIHTQKSARELVPERSLSRLIVLPTSKTGRDTIRLRFVFLLAHQISDGLTNRTWMLHLLELLNTPVERLRSSINSAISDIPRRLISAQETLYPPITGSKARQRWYWAITIVLRHVHKPKPPSFPNPLRRPTPVPATIPREQPFSEALSYTHPPNLNAGTVHIHLTKSQTNHLKTLCREAHCSVGAGLFVLVAITMMEIHELRFPSIPLESRQPFSGSFPINPRAFFNHSAAPDSCMLAFSDGVSLPFLPSHLDLDGRIRLLLRSAQRQLSRYQKRQKLDPQESERETKMRYWGAAGAGRVVAMNYIDAVERSDAKLPPEERKGILPGGVFGKRWGHQATCGVSSVGYIPPAPVYGGPDGKVVDEKFVANLGPGRQGVRPREGEFLVGLAGGDDGVQGNVSYDACAIDPEWAERWRDRMHSILDRGDGMTKL